MSMHDAVDGLNITDCRRVIEVAKAEKRLAEAHEFYHVAALWDEVIKLAEDRLAFLRRK